MSALTPTQWKRLQRAASDGLGMYPGDQWENAPKQYLALEKMGLVHRYIPHNPVHKERAVATEKGLSMLSERSKP